VGWSPDRCQVGIHRGTKSLSNELGAFWTDALAAGINGGDLANRAAADSTNDGCPTFLTNFATKIKATLTNFRQRAPVALKQTSNDKS
tara:strand:+ start:217 stop:480 length:264 start_codon:yes stop_codon:yes gene_type:complete